MYHRVSSVTEVYDKHFPYHVYGDFCSKLINMCDDNNSFQNNQQWHVEPTAHHTGFCKFSENLRFVSRAQCTIRQSFFFQSVKFWCSDFYILMSRAVLGKGKDHASHPASCWSTWTFRFSKLECNVIWCGLIGSSELIVHYHQHYFWYYPLNRSFKEWLRLDINLYLSVHIII